MNNGQIIINIGIKKKLKMIHDLIQEKNTAF